MSALLFVVGPLVLGVVTARLLAGIVPSRRLTLAAGSIALLGFGLHLVLALSEVADYRAHYVLATGQRYVVAVLIGTLFFTRVRQIAAPPRPAPAPDTAPAPAPGITPAPAPGTAPDSAPGTAELDRGERARLASSLHDTVGQGLAVIVMQLRNVERAADPAGPLDVIHSTARETMGEVRRLIGDLRRPEGAGGGARSGAPSDTGADVSWVLNRFRAAGLAVQFSIRGREADLPRRLHEVIIRVLGEALTNALKYAAQQPVSVELTVTDQVVLRVSSRRGDAAAKVLVEDCWQGGEGLRGLADLVGRHGGMLRFGPVRDSFEVLAMFSSSGVDQPVFARPEPAGRELVSAAC